MLPVYFIFTFFVYLRIVSSANENIYRFCVDEYEANGVACQAIQKGNSLVVCVPVSDSADCAMKIQRKEADFGIFTAEEVLLAVKFIDNDVRVVGQLRNRNWINESFAFEMVAVVRENFSGGFTALRSMNYCHPGFSDGQLLSDRILKMFELSVITVNINSCSEDYPVAQLKLNRIAQFFKYACRPGQWVLDDNFDKKLKRKFPTMCDLCDIHSRCSNDESLGSHIAALKCLTENGGDVTYVALQYVNEYFGLIRGQIAKANPEQYKFLCVDGQSQPLNQPCSWIKQPWPTVIATKEKALALSNAIPSFICEGHNCRGTWKEAFTKLFEKSSNIFIPSSDSSRTLTDNVRSASSYNSTIREILLSNFLSDPPTPPLVEACYRKIRWCTTSEDEHEKCEWLKHAVTCQNFDPTLSCVASNSMWSCFDLIKKNEADIISIDSDYAFIADKVFNLTTVMYEDNILDGNYLIIAVVRADRQGIQSLADLKGKRACFPEYNGLAWNSFILAAEKKSILPQVCPKIKAVSQFFKDLCVPGAIDKDHKDYNVTGIDNLCSLCAKKSNNSKNDCEATYNNKYYGHFGAFSCLIGSNTTAAADVAFVDYRRLISEQNEDKWRNIKRADYRIMCPNGIFIPFPNSVDDDIDESCIFSNGIRGQIVGRKHNSKTQMRDITDLLLNMKDKFGESVSDFDNIIRMFGPFKGKKGVLLQETTVDFITAFDETNHHVNYFKELKSNTLEECHEAEKKSSANAITFNITFSLFVFITIFINF